MPYSIESKGFPTSALQQALSLQPTTASNAAGIALRNASGFGQASSTNPTSISTNFLSGTVEHSDAELLKVSQSFESIFLRMIFKEMRNSVQKSAVMGNSRAMEFFETMRDDQLSEHLASSNLLGIGKMVYDKLKETSLAHQKTFS
jgi:peptidoglycan hydrolase FlgJ